MKTVKTSISLPKEIWESIKDRQNKSGIVSTALTFYLDYEKRIARAEQQYWNKVEDSLKGNNDQYMSINSNGKQITDTDIEATLWK